MVVNRMSGLCVGIRWRGKKNWKLEFVVVMRSAGQKDCVSVLDFLKINAEKRTMQLVC